MKKILLIGILAISAASFANTNTHNHGTMGQGTMSGTEMNGSMGKGMMECKMKDGSMGKGMMNGGMMGMNMSPELRKEMEADMIKIQEKQLEVRKIMNTSKPDMKKVEKLNSEISKIKADHMTKMQQNMTKTN